MLTDAERQELEAEMHLFPHKINARIDALQIVQRHRGWISDEALQDIAEFLEISPDEVDSVATFYNLIFRRPVGDHIIRVCDSVTCWIMGLEQISEKLSERLGVKFGQTTTDNRFTLLPIQCLGTCDHAPALMIDEELYRDLTPEQLDGILQPYLQQPATAKREGL
ncbi:MAG: NADH-quinone oxidoreductase subunit NuoE [Caldilineaceae bacterium]